MTDSIPSSIMCSTESGYLADDGGNIESTNWRAYTAMFGYSANELVRSKAARIFDAGTKQSAAVNLLRPTCLWLADDA